MENDSTREWKVLLDQVELFLEIADGLLPINEEQFVECESKIGITLPTSYKDFCRTFGQGCFNRGFVCVDCPLIEDLEGQLISNLEIITATKSLYSNLPAVQKLLNSAYLFGTGSGILFVFDLTTYSELDRCYDIYAIDDNGCVHKAGRDFFEFIQTFCIGDKAKELFPELLRAMEISRGDEDNSSSSPTTFTPTHYLPLSGI